MNCDPNPTCPTPPQPTLILASRSPRRRDLLRRLGLRFHIAPAQITERPAPGESPVETASRLALAKAKAAASPGSVTIGADTIVVFEGQLIGKPRDVDDARVILRLLSGRTHRVVTALALVAGDGGRTIEATESTDVTLRGLAEGEISLYILSGDPMDKAGAYAIQNEEFQLVAAIRGCYSNVLGLPLCALSVAASQLGIAIAKGWEKTGETCDCAANLRGNDLPRPGRGH